MKKKFLYIFSILSLLVLTLAGCGKDNSKTQENSVSANRTSAEISVNNISNSVTNNTTNDNHTVNQVEVAEHDITENEIASFSTKLGGQDSPRTHNIKLTTTALNGTTVNNGETFSFCNTIGVCTAEKGYEKADTFDSNGNTIQAYGGGNCQVSSTLYNAVLKVPDLEVKERHAHSKAVHYVEKDKDAAVAHGSVDFKFKNNTGSTIKIYADSDLNSVNIRIVKVQ